ncbi:MAG: cation:proton antiporter [Bdellovibrionales bacterium]|nr:cation:proton antiporter [Bdellovibrionales bacterium]NQZ18415.1 cation:proton antiporter [Bdellovibrionales bacterium]
MEYAIIGLSFLFFGGHALQWFFTKTKIPDLLILIILGYLLGPVFGIIDKSSLGQVGELVATLALIVILYEAGLQLSTKDLKESWIPSLLLSLLSFISISLVVVTLTTPIVGWPFSLLIAFAVGSTSSAIVIPMVKFLTLEHKTKTILSLESAFTDIFAIVLFLVTLDGILAGKMDAYSIFFNVGPKTMISMGLGLVMAFMWASVKKYASDYTSMKFAGESWALLCYALANLMGLNGAMSVLCLGFCLANLNLLPRWMTQYFSKVPVSFEEMALLSEITFLLKTFFFLYLGLIISLGDWKLVSVGAVIAGSIFITRYLAVRLLFPAKKDYGLMDALSLTSMGPRGLACAVLATIPLQQGIASGDSIQQILFATIPISIFLTATFVFLSEREGFRRKAQFLFPSHKEKAISTEVKSEG